ncbi:IL3RB protein, partial [Pedionomus torquatus]|nr:IL3RB protein [Pedionomus torquatus]
SVLPPVLLPVMLPALTIVFLLGAYCSYRFFLRKKQMWEEKIPNPGKSVLIQSYQGVRGNSTLKGAPGEQLNPVFFQLNRVMKSSPAEFHGAEVKTVQISQATLDPQNPCQTSEMLHKTSFSSTGPSCLCASLLSKSDAHASSASNTCFAFNGPYLYSPEVSSQPDMHQTLEGDPVGVHEKSASLQYVTLPKEDGPQPSQRQEQPAAGPSQPFLLPDQKEVAQHIDDETPASSACGEVMNMRREDQKSPKALSCTASPQQCPLEYITTESLLLPSASDSSHLPLVPAGESPCDSQEP